MPKTKDQRPKTKYQIQNPKYKMPIRLFSRVRPINAIAFQPQTAEVLLEAEIQIENGIKKFAMGILRVE